MIKVKFIAKSTSPKNISSRQIGDVLFVMDPSCSDYDWLVVYDEMPRGNCGSIHRGEEVLACPSVQTILVTSEPPNIKIYPRCYTHQFGYVLTTHMDDTLPHPGRRLSCGALLHFSGHAWEEIQSEPIYEKTHLISSVCSAKQMKHTEHFNRFSLTKFLSENLQDFSWYGRGVAPLKQKYDALNSFKYHVAVENYISAYHWTDKIIDPILSHCLTFYAGDPVLGEFLPPDSFIPIPLDDHQKALDIIKQSIENNEYEKRLPAILKARHLLVTQYNTFHRIIDVIKNHPSREQSKTMKNVIVERHALRKNPLNLISEGWDIARAKWKMASK